MNSEQALTALAEGIKKTGATACQTSDPDAWFPEGGVPNTSLRSAISLCKICPVRSLCLEFALVNDEKHGIWGGVNTRQRARLRNARG